LTISSRKYASLSSAESRPAMDGLTPRTATLVPPFECPLLLVLRS
jgi:hypothetical protein